ncbi:MAG: SH3 domain-containing protein [Spirochaetaceae bacterium]|nr:SH3 domain-containing protein [Spirochaetaceae bacterium]
MKNKIMFLCLVLGGIFLFSCQKKENVENKDIPGFETAVFESGEKFLPGVLLYSEWVKNVEEADGKMKYKTTGNVGEVVKVYTKEGSKTEPEKKTAYRSGSKEIKSEEREFYHIKAEDGDFWVQSVFIAVDAVPAAVSGANTVIYSKPELANPSTTVIPLYTIVGVHDKDSKGDFVSISAYQTPGKPMFVENKFIKKDKITRDARDIQVLQLYQTAVKTKNDVQKREMLVNALGLGGTFEDLVNTAIDELNNTAVVFTRSPYSPNGTYTISTTSGVVNIRDNPGLHETQVLFSLENGEPVVPTEKTNEQDHINGYDDYWYKIEVPALGQTGWVFGAYLPHN